VWVAIVTDTVENLRTDLQDSYEDDYEGWNNYLRESVTDMEIHLGAQFTHEEQEWAQQNDRTLYAFGKSSRQVELLSGYEIRNRHLLKIGPVGREDDNACRQHTTLLNWQMSLFSGYECLSQAFKWGNLVTGSNLFEFWRDRQGLIRFARRSFNSFLLDRNLSNPDLSDCTHILCGRWLAEDKIKALLPTETEKIEQIPRMQWSQRWNKMPGAQWANKDTQRLYEEWYRPQTRLEAMVVSRLSGAEFTVAEAAAKAKGLMDERMVNYYVDQARMPNGMPMFSRFNKTVDWMRLCLFVDGEPMFDGEQPLMMSATRHFDEYPFVWLHGEWAPECDRDDLKLQSFTRGLRSSTRARNRRINQMIDIVETRLQNVRIVRQDSLVDKEDAYRSGQGHPIFIKKNAAGPLTDHFQQQPSPDLPPGLFSLCELLEREETQAKGLNDEIFGSDDKENVPGILARFRTGQALTGQQGIFDNFRQSKRQIGRKAVKLNQGQMDPIRLQRILAEPPDPAFYENDFAKYDCTPVEAILNEDQQAEAFSQMMSIMQVVPKLMEMVPPSMLVQMAPISVKRELLAAIQAAEQQGQQQMQYQLRNAEILNNLIEAQTMVGVQKAKAESAGAMLDNVKAAVEVQNLQQQPNLDRLDRIIKIMDIAQRAQQAQQKPQLTGGSK
jgi:hypothetical protein